MRSVADEILYALSARRAMPWPAFREAVDYLYEIGSAREILDLSQVMRARRQILRNLDSLGHCDFEFGRTTAVVYAAPPVLARLPYATPEAVLCGARAQNTVDRVLESAGGAEPSCEVVIEEPRSRLSVAPARILIRSPSVRGLQGLARTLGISCSTVPPAWLFANLAPSLRQVSERCQWHPMVEPNWPAKDWHSESYSFRARDRAADTRLTSYRDPRTNRYLTLAWIGDRCAEIDRDWGRYWLLQQEGRQVIRYDERRLRLSVPARVPLPKLYARALVLCSGGVVEDAGRTSDGLEDPPDGTADYRGVPPQIAQAVCEKIEQR